MPGLGMKMQDVFERVLRQAEQRRAQHERALADDRHLEWQRALVMRLLVRRFGDVPNAIALRVQKASAEALDRYADKLVIAGSAAEAVADE